MKKDPCEYQTHRDGRQSRALSYLSQAGLCTHLHGAHSCSLFKRLSGIFWWRSLLSSFIWWRRSDTRDTCQYLEATARLGERGRKTSFTTSTSKCLGVGEGAHIGESYHRKELLIAMSSQSYSRDWRIGSYEQVSWLITLNSYFYSSFPSTIALSG